MKNEKQIKEFRKTLIIFTILITIGLILNAVYSIYLLIYQNYWGLLGITSGVMFNICYNMFVRIINRVTDEIETQLKKEEAEDEYS